MSEKSAFSFALSKAELAAPNAGSQRTALVLLIVLGAGRRGGKAGATPAIGPAHGLGLMA
jgi:hypothetical protein